VKHARCRELLDKIREVASGCSSIDLRAAERLAVSAQRERDRAPAEEPRLRALTARQRRVLALIAEGRTNRQIAAELVLSEKSVKNCVSSILLTLGVSRRVEAAVFATQLRVNGDEAGSTARSDDRQQRSFDHHP
jgi:two-component system, NarL family, response regulator DevR